MSDTQSLEFKAMGCNCPTPKLDDKGCVGGARSIYCPIHGDPVVVELLELGVAHATMRDSGKFQAKEDILREASITLRALIDKRERDEKVKVKPLEWDDVQAESVVGTYDFGRIGGMWTLRLDGDDIETGFSTNFRAAGGDAKAAAQDDYDRRILSALDTLASEGQQCTAR